MDREIRVPQATMLDVLVPLGLLVVFWAQWLVFRSVAVAPAATTFIFWLAMYACCCVLFFSRQVLSRLGSVLVIGESRIKLDRRGRTAWELPWSEFGGYLPLKPPGVKVVTGGKILRKDGQILATVSFVPGFFGSKARLEQAARAAAEIDKLSQIDSMMKFGQRKELARPLRILLAIATTLGTAAFGYGSMRLMRPPGHESAVRALAFVGLGMVLTGGSALAQLRN